MLYCTTQYGDFLHFIIFLGVSSWTFEDDLIRNKALGLHWTGQVKPWMKGCKYGEIFKRYMVVDPKQQYRVLC